MKVGEEALFIMNLKSIKIKIILLMKIFLFFKTDLWSQVEEKLWLGFCNECWGSFVGEFGCALQEEMANWNNVSSSRWGVD